MIPEDPFRRAGWYAWAIVVVLIISVLGFCGPVRAQGSAAVVFDCRQLADSLEAIVDFRDAGADQDKVIAIFRGRVGNAAPAHADVVAREVRRMWHEGLPPKEAAFQLYKRCQANGGDMGREA